ncbi:MAG: apolipoprotein N-acyltransferase [Pseudomonadaceae bacterium]|nr:MAG: apolipoprotein N-acyltransferase [Pseudomonadaceae bacterium]
MMSRFNPLLSRRDSFTGLAADTRLQRGFWSAGLLAVVSGVLWFVPWLAPALFITAWLAPVPLLFALQRATAWRALLLGWLAGTVYFAGTSYWVIDFAINMRGISWLTGLALAAMFWIYAGLSLAFGCLLAHHLRRALPSWQFISFPLAIVVSMGLFPLLFESRFAEAQTGFLLALQGVDLVGAQGLDVLMLMFAVLIYQSLRWRRDAGRWLRHPSLLGCGLLLIWFAYSTAGWVYWEREVAQWSTKRVGLVQPNDAPTIDVPPPPEGFSREFPPEMQASQRLVDAGAELVIWPEARYKGYFDMFSVRQAYADKVAEWGVPLVFHDAESQWIRGEQVGFNTVTLLDAEGRSGGHYRKMERMPFGEYLPAFFSLPGIDWLTKRFFGEFLRPLGAGGHHGVFFLDDLLLVPKICYETAFPESVAEAIGDDAAGKVLLFVSQDNWFGETRQPFQHRDMSIVRGIENRVPMIHVINNGPSVVATPSGRIVASTRAFSQTELVADMPFSPKAGGSFFSRHPQLFSGFSQGVLGLMVLFALIGRWRQRR